MAIAAFGAMFWLGGLDSKVADLSLRLDRVDRDSVAFQSQMREKLDGIATLQANLKTLMENQQNATSRHR